MMPPNLSLNLMTMPSFSQHYIVTNIIRQTLTKRFSLLASLALAFVTQLYTPCANAQSLQGVEVGATFSTVESLKLKPLAKDFRNGLHMAKFLLQSGNKLSITYSESGGIILYVEADWNMQSDSKATGVAGLLFGTTALGDIRKRYGSNGFTWQANPMVIKDDKIIAFNAYEIQNRPGMVVVFATGMAADGALAALSDSEAMGKNFRLLAIILAQERYLDFLWGNEKIYDPNIRPIRW